MGVFPTTYARQQPRCSHNFVGLGFRAYPGRFAWLTDCFNFFLSILGLTQQFVNYRDQLANFAVQFTNRPPSATKNSPLTLSDQIIFARTIT